MLLTRIHCPQIKPLSLFVLTITLIMLTVLPLQGHVAQAGGGNSILVNSLSDNATICAVSGTECLRNAIVTANSDAFALQINFNVAGTITLSATLPAITNTYGLIIDGSNGIVIDGANAIQIFIVSSGAVATLERLTIQRGFSATSGGGVRNNGNLTINSSTLTYNSAKGGGGVSNTGVLTIIWTTLSHNSVPTGGGGGGGVLNASGGTLSVSFSTFFNNTVDNDCGGGLGNDGSGTVATIRSTTFDSNFASTTSGCGGALYNYLATMVITNSTFSGNGAQFGGAIHQDGGAITIGNSTFSNNSGSFGAGIYNLPTSNGTLNMMSVISAKNTLIGDRPNGPDVFGTVHSGGANLIGDDTTSSGFFTAVGDQIGTAGTPINPNLGPLQLNNGPLPYTATMALLPGSPALGKGLCGGNTSLTPNVPSIHTDQRGVARKLSYLYAGCDVGAFELPNLDSIGIYRSGTFYLRLHNSQGNSDLNVTFNPPGQNWPIVGDWTGAIYDTVGVYDQSGGRFTLCKANDTVSCTSATKQISFLLGNPNDMPLSGRWLANAIYDGAGVYRSTNGILYMKNTLVTGFSDYADVLGNPGDIGVAGDWTDKGFDSPGIYRPTESKFYLSNQVINGIVFADISALYGNPGDFPVIGDWVSQGHDGIGLFRQSVGYTYLRNTTDTGAANNSFFYGSAGDVPVAGHWQSVYGPVAPPASISVPPILISKPVTPVTPPSNSAPGGNQIGG